MPKIIEIIVVIKHITTKTEPMAIKLPLLIVMRNIKKLTNIISTNQRNHCFAKILGKGLLRLSIDNIISKKAPRGQRFQHQYRPLKNERTKRKNIMAITK